MKLFTIYSSILFFFFCSCGDGDSTDQQVSNSDSLQIDNEQATIFEPVQDKEVDVFEKEGITLTEIKSENDKGVSINLLTNKFREGENDINFKVEGADDYYISIIENNYAISHHKSNIIKKEFLYGNNVFLAFLTHQNGISIKTNKANVLKNVLIDDESLFNMNQQHLFYYLPKEKTASPVLDFCMVNTSLSENGNKVKVTINEIEFVIKKWAAYQISGLPKVENTIRIQLIDQAGNPIEGPFNDSGDRSFTITKESV